MFSFPPSLTRSARSLGHKVDRGRGQTSMDGVSRVISYLVASISSVPFNVMTGATWIDPVTAKIINSDMFRDLFIRFR